MIADLAQINPAYLLLGVVAAYFVFPYLKAWHLRDLPTPGLAGFTNLWLLIQARKGHRFESVDNLHKKHGKLVRIAPRHVSIADDAAINAVYGHGNGFLKAYVPASHPSGPVLTSVATSTMPSSPSVAVSSTRATVRSTPASGRPSRTPSV